MEVLCFFAFVTVVITVHAYVFYSLYVIHGSTFIANTGASGVLEAINMMGGVPVLGHNVPIWVVVLIEFVLAYTLEIFVGSSLSFKIACHYFCDSVGNVPNYELYCSNFVLSI